MKLALPLPVMAFATNEGLDAPLWNTIRLGRGWAKRLAAGDAVILTHKDQAIGVARVESTTFGRLPEMVDAHHTRNHSGMSKDEMLEALLKTYGPHRITPTAYLSVVYLQPLKGQHTLTL